MFNKSQKIQPEPIKPEQMTTIEILKKFGVPTSFKEIGNFDKNATSPDKEPFYLVPTHFVTSIALTEIVSKIDAIIRSETILHKTPSADSSDPLNYKTSPFSWQFKQDQPGEQDDLCAMAGLKSTEMNVRCTTYISIYAKNRAPGVFIVEVNRLNGDSYMFNNTWNAIKNTFA